LAALGERNSLRAVARLFQVKLDTLRHWLERAVQNRPRVEEMLIRNLDLKKMQVDRLWDFTRKKTDFEIPSQES
jgi:hypothetical protein